MKTVTRPDEDISNFFRLMRRQFTSAEWETIGEIGGRNDLQNQLRMFYRFWCLKESFVKADGKGLNWDLQRINFKVRFRDFFGQTL